MRRVWVSILTVWALVALVAVLAWAHRPGATPAASGQAVVVKGANGTSRVVLVQGGVHGTTQTSPGAAAAQAAPAGASPVALVRQPGAGG